MAQSPAHKFGQIIGDTLEVALEPILREFAAANGLFLDKKGPRPARPGMKVTWIDNNGNSHDLDYVLERGGSPQARGTPVAFIETAWRRYTKHSRNKAQEIQGAVIPLSQKYASINPFLGAVLAGVFTDGSISQLRSLGFRVLYFPYDLVVQAFGRAGLSADHDEATPDAHIAQRVREWDRMPTYRRGLAAQALVDLNAREIQAFMDALATFVSRRVVSVAVFPLHGVIHHSSSLEEAARFIRAYQSESSAMPLARFEVEIGFSNGDHVRGSFQNKDTALSFLTTFP